MKALAVFVREWRIAWSGGSGMALPVCFFAGATLLIPFAIGAEPDRLSGVAVGLLFVALALSSLISLERMVQSDLEDGALDGLVVGPFPLEITALLKVLAHWSMAGLPLALMFPLLALMLAAPGTILLPGMAVFALASLSFFLWGGVGAALTAGVRRSGPLIAILVLPLYGPVVIFGAGALSPTGDSAVVDSAALLFLAAYALLALAISPFAMAAAMRLAVD